MMGAMDVTRVAAKTSGGTTQDITLTGFGTPTAAVIFGIGATADNVQRDDELLSIGFTDGTNVRCVADHSRDTSQEADRNTSSSRLVTFLDSAGAVDGAASFDSFITDGIRIDWSNFPTNAYFLHVVLIQATGQKADHVVLSTQDTLVQTTGVGFTSKLILTAGVGGGIDTSVVHRIISFGAATATAKFAQLASVGDEASNSLNILWTDGVGGQAFSTSENWRHEISNIGSDGWDNHARDGDSSGDSTIFLALDFDEAVWVGGIDLPTTTGNETVSGFGFTRAPQFGFQVSGGQETADAIDTGSSAGQFWLSTFSAANAFALSAISQDGTSKRYSNSDDIAVNYDTGSGVNIYDATFVSFESTNNGQWTLNYSGTSGAVRKAFGIALEEAEVVAPSAGPPKGSLAMLGCGV